MQVNVEDIIRYLISFLLITVIYQLGWARGYQSGKEFGLDMATQFSGVLVSQIISKMPKSSRIKFTKAFSSFMSNDKDFDDLFEEVLKRDKEKIEGR